MIDLDKLIQYWKTKNRNRTAGAMSSPDPWVQHTITCLQQLKTIRGEQK